MFRFLKKKTKTPKLTTVKSKTHDSMMVAFNTIDINRAISHYMPPHFPFVQSINQADIDKFASLWEIIYNDRTLRPGGVSMLSDMFEIFYAKLFERSDKFQVFFGTNHQERCRILSRQMIFFTTVKLDDNINQVFQDLGKLHQQLGISNWMYSMFVEVLLETLYAILGAEAEITKMKSATKVLSFCLFKLLEHTLLPTTVRPLEMNINFRDNKIEDIIERLEMKETMELTKKMDDVSEKDVKFTA